MRVISGTARGTKLFSLEGLSTRPTLDRVKESLFNILQPKIPQANVLDLFAGSGALGIEALSRGASQVTFCDKSPEAIAVIKKNLVKTRLEEKSVVIKDEAKKVLDKLAVDGKKYDLIFLDPPYETSLAISSLTEIVKSGLLTEDGTIVIETDDEKRIGKELANFKQIQVKDLRKYGRAYLIFLNRKG